MKFRKFLFWTGYTFLVLIMLEITTRVFFAMTHQDFAVYRHFSFSRESRIAMSDDLLGWKLRPGISRNALTSEFQVVYTTNSLGLREKELSDTTKFRILFLGDSFTFGEGLQQELRFSDLIEKEIGGAYSINAGVPGYGVHQMSRYLEHAGIKFRPDLVICTIISQDLDRVFCEKLKTSSHMNTAGQGGKASLAQRSSRSFWEKIKRDVVMRSYFLTLIYVEVRLLLARRHLREKDAQAWRELADKNRPKEKALRELDKQKWMRDESFKIFRGMKKLLADSKIDFLVLNISRNPMPWFDDFLKAERIECLDLSRLVKDDPNLYFRIDPHMNASGNRLVADRLKAYLLQRYKTQLSPVTTG